MLALLCERPTHGWAIARQLSPTGELGSIWSLGRPLVYRSIEILSERKLIVPAGHEPGARGPNRTIFRATPAGHAAIAEWLLEPVEHVREGRSLLLLKLVFARRNCVDPRPMLLSQHDGDHGGDRLARGAGARERRHRHDPAPVPARILARGCPLHRGRARRAGPAPREPSERASCPPATGCRLRRKTHSGPSRGRDGNCVRTHLFGARIACPEAPTIAVRRQLY